MVSCGPHGPAQGGPQPSCPGGGPAERGRTLRGRAGLGLDEEGGGCCGATTATTMGDDEDNDDDDDDDDDDGRRGGPGRLENRIRGGQGRGGFVLRYESEDWAPEGRLRFYVFLFALNFGVCGSGLCLWTLSINTFPLSWSIFPGVVFRSSRYPEASSFSGGPR